MSNDPNDPIALATKIATAAAKAEFEKAVREIGYDRATGRPIPEMADSQENVETDTLANSRFTTMGQMAAATPEERERFRAGRRSTPEQRYEAAKAAIVARNAPKRPGLGQMVMDPQLGKQVADRGKASRQPEALAAAAVARDLAALDEAKAREERRAAAADAKDADHEKNWWAARDMTERVHGERRAIEGYGPPKEQLDAEFKMALSQWEQRNAARDALEKAAGKVAALRTYGQLTAKPQPRRPWADQSWRAGK